MLFGKGTSKGGENQEELQKWMIRSALGRINRAVDMVQKPNFGRLLRKIPLVFFLYQEKQSFHPSLPETKRIVSLKSDPSNSNELPRNEVILFCSQALDLNYTSVHLICPSDSITQASTYTYLHN